MNASIKAVTIPAERPQHEQPIRVENKGPDANGVTWIAIEYEDGDELLVTPGEARKLAQALLTVAGE